MTVLLAFLCSLALAATPYGAPAPLKASDGVKLAAVHAAPSRGTNGVVLVHDDGGSKEEWASLAGKLARTNLWVVSVDLRGHGQSHLGHALAAGDYPDMTRDVAAAITFLRGKGVTRVALVGAGLGANLALTTAADDPTVVSVAMLSPLLDAHGIAALPALDRLGPRALLLVASADDPLANRAARLLASRAPGEDDLLLYPSAGSGTRMLSRAPDLESRLLGFVNSSWASSPAPAAPPTGPPPR